MNDFDSCCDCPDPQPPVPERVNPPGRTALAFRVGDHRSFLARMLEALPAQTIPGASSDVHPLAALNTRAADDPVLALADAWATSLDVLTFYQERIANEGYLRTATERRSVLELGLNLGHELLPGIAASVHLAFTVEDTTEVTQVSQGTRVQSLPAQGQVPQTFEVSEDTEVRAEWNKLRPRRTQPQDLRVRRRESGTSLFFPDAPEAPSGADPFALPDPPGEIFLKGTTTNVKAGDVLLLTGPDGDGETAIAVPLLRVVPDPSAGRTKLELGVPLPLPRQPLPPLEITDAPANIQFIFDSRLRESELRARLTLENQSATEVATQVNLKLAAARPSAAVFAMRQRVSFFGHNAQPFSDVLTPPVPPPPAGIKLEVWTAAWNDGWSKFNWDQGQTIWQFHTGAPWPGQANVFLERRVPEIIAGSWVVFNDPRAASTRQVPFQVKAVVESSVADYGIAGAATGLQLLRPVTTLPFGVRTSSALVQSDPLELVELPITDPIVAGTRELMLDRMILGLRAGQPVWISGARDDAPGLVADEIAFLADIVHDRGYTTLLFEAGLKFRYVRDSVTLNLNLAVATHGETVAVEVLGSGDASQPNQSFVLKKPNITHVSAPTETGLASTVSLRVNNVLWREVDSLLEQDASAQVYTLYVDNEGRTIVTFGDGQNGARLPTGQENIVASYRTSVTALGALGAGTLTLLQTRPLGVRAVTNPLATTGANGPDTLEGGRANVPVTALTLDRVVTLRDYEDFTRAFAGIGAAKATLLRRNRSTLVHITAVNDQGAPIEPNTALFRNLQSALLSVSDPEQEVLIAGARVHLFGVRAGLLLDPRRLASEVLASARAAMRSAFSLNNNRLGEAVTPAAVFSVLQGTPGVIAVELTQLALVGEPIPPTLITLPARAAHLDGNDVIAADLLMLDANSLELSEVGQ